MKTFVLFIMMLSVIAASHAQFKGVPFDEAISYEEASNKTSEELYEVLVKVEKESATIYNDIFEVTSKGYSDALTRLSDILEANNITQSPDVEESYFPSHVDENNYNEVVQYLRAEKGWIKKTWNVYDDKWRLVIMGNNRGIGIAVIHYK